MNMFSRFGYPRKRPYEPLFDDVSNRVSKRRNSDDSQNSAELSVKTQFNNNTQLPTPEVSPIKPSGVLERKFSELNLIKHIPKTEDTHQIFKIPEILANILKFVQLQDYCESDKHAKEIKTLLRGRNAPQSYRHCLMMYQNEEVAKHIWNKLTEKSSQTTTNNDSNTLYNCLSVNKLWYYLGAPMFSEQIVFENEDMFRKFLINLTTPIKPKSIIIKNIRSTVDYTTYLLNPNLNLSEVTHLELKLCHYFVPPVQWFKNLTKLETLSFPGSKKISDRYLFEVLMDGSLSNLKHLDLRACENVTDAGIVYVATKCPQLQSCNLGRHKSGESITGVSVAALSMHTNIETLGLTGCNINDAAIWELANTCGKNITRLAINNCKLLSNLSLRIITNYTYFPNLSVLEIKNVPGFIEVKSLVVFKNWKHSIKRPFLLETCERVNKLIQTEESKVMRTNSLTAIRDMTEWVNENIEDKC
ncbi:hypothetical protein TPHA_0L01450 [Tetrapisispora phaffii CBS 4417]|uniref:F-box/LRR-repeat protein 15-like leucin rich repeat domain-containing protein n=1 Tax=Tetrapisispora phaffii (strain ATCC 24235 / CBS 4417 / NBRC 1672 / NRRL Y-8282 / UCD 70-5) TaxID=1071381 RepID=G8C022_TETPH|nr:hypothetical protein TPHA_0L01450 [Tetrapisispora phaffii CBS 4417]CCE65500.1 hypothetical protein TPHA_0L01450 [Tetrapisispora phaffii CBS 4417]